MKPKDLKLAIRADWVIRQKVREEINTHLLRQRKVEEVQKARYGGGGGDKMFGAGVKKKHYQGNDGTSRTESQADQQQQVTHIVYKDKNEIRMTHDEFEEMVLNSSDESRLEDEQLSKMFKGQGLSLVHSPTSESRNYVEKTKFLELFINRKQKYTNYDLVHKNIKSIMRTISPQRFSPAATTFSSFLTPPAQSDTVIQKFKQIGGMMHKVTKTPYRSGTTNPKIKQRRSSQLALFQPKQPRSSPTKQPGQDDSIVEAGLQKIGLREVDQRFIGNNELLTFLDNQKKSFQFARCLINEEINQNQFKKKRKSEEVQQKLKRAFFYNMQRHRQSELQNYTSQCQRGKHAAQEVVDQMRQCEKLYFEALDSMSLGKEDQYGYQALNLKYAISSQDLKKMGEQLLTDLRREKSTTDLPQQRATDEYLELAKEAREERRKKEMESRLSQKQRKLKLRKSLKELIEATKKATKIGKDLYASSEMDKDESKISHLQKSLTIQQQNFLGIVDPTQGKSNPVVLPRSSAMIDKLRLRHLKTAASPAPLSRNSTLQVPSTQLFNAQKDTGMIQLRKAMKTISKLVPTREEVALLDEQEEFNYEKQRVKRDVMMSHQYFMGRGGGGGA